MTRIALFFFLIGSLAAGVREEALVLANQAGEVFETDPSTASRLAGKAYQLLAKSEESAAADLAACAGLTARSARFANEIERAQIWFQKALTHAEGEDAIVLRSELGDLLMRRGDLAEARRTLGPVPRLAKPSAILAQWLQTSAKLHLTCGLPAEAKTAITAAREALPPDDLENQIALTIDAAGIALRLEEPVDELIQHARTQLKKLDSPDPNLLSALTSVAAQAPGLTDAEALTILQSLALERLPKDTRITYSVTLAEAALKQGDKALASRTLEPVVEGGVLPQDHPLLARALNLYAQASGLEKPALLSSRIAMNWLERSDDSDLLLGLQRTVDPVTPLVLHSPSHLPKTALITQNFALRKRLGGTTALPDRQTILYLLYQKDFKQHYGALIYTENHQHEQELNAIAPKETSHWVDLGPADQIHQRIMATLDTAERTLAEVNTGATLSVRLTQLWKSLWAPLADKIDPARPVDIAPVGMLHAVPWATLRQRDGKFLCQIQSEARILALTGSFSTAKRGDSFIACGFEKSPGRLPDQGAFPFDNTLSKLVGNLPALPGVTEELSKLGGTSYFDPDRPRFLELLKTQPDVLHIAGHGFVIESEEGTGFRAGLVLGGGQTDRVLFAREIAALDLSKTKLVVLSACRGGIGRGEVGGNWSSLRRSFIAAGVEQVLAAQWRVRDDHLPGFMADFHRRREKKDAPLALWELQRDLVSQADEISLASAAAWVIECVPAQKD